MTSEEAIKEKKIPKTVTKDGHCPVCGEWVVYKYIDSTGCTCVGKDEYCRKCGQKIKCDWEDLYVILGFADLNKD